MYYVHWYQIKGGIEGIGWTKQVVVMADRRKDALTHLLAGQSQLLVRGDLWTLRRSFFHPPCSPRKYHLLGPISLLADTS